MKKIKLKVFYATMQSLWNVLEKTLQTLNSILAFLWYHKGSSYLDLLFGMQIGETYSVLIAY